MEINYDVPITPGKSVKFKGELTAEETEFLLQLALVTLLQRGMLVSSIAAQEEVFEPIPKEQVN